MISARTGSILNYIVGQYIAGATPVPSQAVANKAELNISPATIRNEMAQLEQEGYIFRPHPSAGSIPSDKGYRYYVESLENMALPSAEQRLVSHLFHQVEIKIDKWLSLAATLAAQMVNNMVVVTKPKLTDCKFKHVEMVSLQDFMMLVILVLHGAGVRQQLITSTQPLSQEELTAIASKLNDAYSGLSSDQISTKELGLSPFEKQVTDCLIKMMQAEDEEENEVSYLDGLHFMLNQPEFTNSRQMLNLMEMAEHRRLLKAIIPEELANHQVQVIIGGENKAETLHKYSVVICQYGLPEEASGTICVVGPTRMPYAHTIPTVGYLSLVMTRLVARLYGRDISDSFDLNENNN